MGMWADGEGPVHEDSILPRPHVKNPSPNPTPYPRQLLALPEAGSEAPPAAAPPTWWVEEG